MSVEQAPNPFETTSHPATHARSVADAPADAHPLRQGGADVFSASLGQGLFSDPIDKLITSFIVFIILSNLSSRFLARFPLGERLIRPVPVLTADAGTVPPYDAEDT